LVKTYLVFMCSDYLCVMMKTSKISTPVTKTAIWT
jgi:hypothetical protein